MGTAISAQITADVIYINGNIYTVDDAFTRMSVIATKGDKIVYVGNSSDETDHVINNAAKIVDLKGKTVIPGLIEGHMHFQSVGQVSLNVNGFKLPKEEILELVSQRVKSLKPGQWIRGGGWDHMQWPDKNWPTKEELDAVSPNNPVALDRIDLHTLWVNSKALDLAKITNGTPDPKGGEIVRDKDGGVVGILIDTARDDVFGVIPPISDEVKMKAFLLAQEECFSYGLTSIFDAGTPFGDIMLLKKAYENDELKIRTYELLSTWDGSDVQYINAGLKPEKGLYNNRLSINAVKIFVDGTIGSRSAYFFEEYSDRPGHRGKSIYTDEELYKLVARAGKHGFQVATHAIGDAAIRQVMDVYKRVQNEQALTDPRFRIEHFSVPRPEDIPEAVKLGFIPSIQACGAASDVSVLIARIGPERLKTVFPWREIIAAGGYVVGGSDANVNLLNPYHGLCAGITMADSSGNPSGFPRAGMTREESLKSFTIWAAKGQFEENIKGSLEVGKLADFVVIDRDIMSCNTTDIWHTQVLLTILGGEVVFDRKDTDCSKR